MIDLSSVLKGNHDKANIITAARPTHMTKFRCAIHICHKGSNLLFVTISGKRWAPYCNYTKSQSQDTVFSHLLLSYHKHYPRAPRSSFQNSSFIGGSHATFQRINSGLAKKILKHPHFTAFRKSELQSNISFDAVVPKSLTSLENLKNFVSVT